MTDEPMGPMGPPPVEPLSSLAQAVRPAAAATPAAAVRKLRLLSMFFSFEEPVQDGPLVLVVDRPHRVQPVDHCSRCRPCG